MSRKESEKWFEEFTGHEVDGVKKINFKMPKVVGVVGRIHSICYEATRDYETELYEHEFKENNAPTLAVSDDGRQLMILGGHYVVTDHGIED